MKKNKMKNKKGIASFYIVAFSTLILVVIATSFAAVIISEIERTANDDLAQSAYDSALAGVEDAKLAVYSYQECAKNSSFDPEGCAKVKELVEKPENYNCDQVADILGRIREEDGGVLVQETSGNNNMQQAYTCVMFTGITNNYKATLTASNQSRIIRPEFDTDGADTGITGGVHARDVKKIKVSWYSGNNKNSNNGELNYNNFQGGAVTFPSVGMDDSTTATPTPPVIAVGLIQASDSFTLSSFERTVGDATNRGLIYLVPTNDASTVGKSGDDLNYTGSSEGNNISRSAFLKSNNKEKSNKPYTVVCDETGDYICSAIIELPNVVNGTRSDENFAITVSLPYGRPDTDVVVEFICDKVCSYDDGGTGVQTAKLEWVQVEVDSTGRANDLYRRVEMRLEGDSSSIISGMNALEIVGDIKKDIWTTCEYDFEPTCF